MGEATQPLFTGWANFYVITGSAAAALTGLQFVVVVLGAQMNRGSFEANAAFGTPTIVHFCTVLFIAGILTAPWPSPAPVAYILGLCGAAGIVYAGAVLRAARRQTAYRPVLEDWLFHFTLPPVAYVTLLVAGLMLRSKPALSLFEAGGAVLLLLFVGIHNAWDSASFIALHPRPRRERDEGEG